MNDEEETDGQEQNTVQTLTKSNKIKYSLDSCMYSEIDKHLSLHYFLSNVEQQLFTLY